MFHLMIFGLHQSGNSLAQSCPTSCNPMDCSMPGSLSITKLKAYLNSYKSIQWCHPTVSSSVVPFSSCFKSFPASDSFPMNQFFTSGSQRIGVSASASVLPMNIQGSFPLGLNDWSPCCPRDSQVSSPTSQFKSINSSVLSFLYSPNLTSIHD